MSMYISVYVRNAEAGPSCYYRIIQYANAMNEYEFTINSALTKEEFCRNLNYEIGITKKIYQFKLLIRVIIRRFKSVLYDIKNKPACIIISREIVPRFIPLFLLKKIDYLTRNVPTIWDYDDDIFTFGEISERERLVLLKNSNKIIVTHDYLKQLLPNGMLGKSIVMPTTDGACTKKMYNESLWDRGRRFEEALDIVWLGTSSNLDNLEIALPGINQAAGIIRNKTGKKVILHIVCNKPVVDITSSYKELTIDNIKWGREKAMKILLTSHVGIMPLKHSDFSEGKGAFKLIQYLACGLPVIASSEGYNKVVVNSCSGKIADNTTEWCNAVISISRNLEVWMEFSNKARERFELKYGYDRNLETLREIIKQTINGNRESRGELK